MAAHRYIPFVSWDFFFKLHFKIGQFPGIFWISSFSGKLGRSGDPRPTDPQATITSLHLPGPLERRWARVFAAVHHHPSSLHPLLLLSWPL